VINPPSSQKPYDEFWSRDKSFAQRPELPKGADDDAKEAHEKALEEYQRLLTIALDHGDWSALRIEGTNEPTRFPVRPLTGKQMRWIASQNNLGMADGAALVFRACILGMVNAGDFEMPKPERHPGLGMIAPEEVTNYLDSIDMGIVTEIGLRLLERGTRGLSPK
jgi:hypothetical protein